jgi:two-component system, response regulator PdtaR
VQKSVLIVEDELLIALDLAMVLETDGWRVLGPARTVAEALRLLKTDRPSVALLDVNLGREWVTPVAEDLAARQIPFAIASAYLKPEEVAGNILSGVPNVGKPAVDRTMLKVLAALAGL